MSRIVREADATTGVRPGPESNDAWCPTLGAWPDGSGTHFRLWAPRAQRVQVVLERSRGRPRTLTMPRADDGTFSLWVPDARAGDRYRYRLNGAHPLPDPASRFQPDGVHGPSEIIDPRGYRWSDDGWTGVALEDAVFYELHVGTFSPEGSFDGVSARLPDLKDLGITIVELMLIADFPGERNWGYDGASLFAPARGYGRPDDLRGLVDRAHQLGLAAARSWPTKNAPSAPSCEAMPVRASAVELDLLYDPSAGGSACCASLTEPP